MECFQKISNVIRNEQHKSSQTTLTFPIQKTTADSISKSTVTALRVFLNSPDSWAECFLRAEPSPYRIWGHALEK